MRSPKLANDRTSDWYRFYAGYSHDFVEDALETLGVKPGATILDPWNGSGTTTFVAHQLGFSPIGFDANPALVVIGRARLLGSEVIESLGPIADDIVGHAGDVANDSLLEDEPLENWLRTESAQNARRLEWAIQHVLVDHDCYRPLREAGALESVSALAAFFYVALFESIREQLRPFVSSNPTWVKLAQAEQRLGIEWSALKTAFLSAVGRLAKQLEHHAATSAPDATNAVRQANSMRLPLADNSIEGAVASPPYCTRIDYIIATRPELAVLGFNKDDLRALRFEMVGTPTIHPELPTGRGEWGAIATELLANIGAHSSYASGGYYRKYFHQYVDALWKSLADLRRVLRPGAGAVLVVQDSYYKELHIDLAGMVREMAGLLSWQNVERIDFAIPRTKAAMNPAARSWRTSVSATDSVLIFV